MYPFNKLKENLKDETSRVEKRRMVTCILTKDGSLNLRATEQGLERMFFEEMGEIVKVKIRRWVANYMT